MGIYQRFKSFLGVAVDVPMKRGLGQPYSQQATMYPAGLVLNDTVDIKEYRHDRYGRVLGVVYLGGRNVNLQMVETRFAEVYCDDLAPGQDFAPYWQAEERARARKIGM